MTKPDLQNIDAETQIFTPRYIGKYLAENSIGRIWMASHPESPLADRMGWWVDCDNPAGLATVDSPEDIRVIDPACGTGNLLVAAFDMLAAIYRSAGYQEADIPALILSKNLVGRDIDSAAADAASAILTARAHTLNDHFFRSGIHPDVRAFTSDDDPQAGLLGTLIRTLDTDSYHVVIGNPPYMGAKHFTPELKRFAKDEYRDSKADLCAMFIERGHEMTAPGGIVAMITMESWMFLSSFEALRRKLISERTTITMAHLGHGVFGRGAVISTTAFVQASCHDPACEGAYFRMVDAKHKEFDLHTEILNRRLEMTTRNGLLAKEAA